MSSAEEEVNANYYFRNLVTLHVRITLLSDVFATAGYAHGRQAIGLLQTLMTSITPQVVKDLGSLHRASIWENIVLKLGLQAKGLDLSSSPTISLEATPNQLALGLPDGAGVSSAQNANGTVEGPAEESRDSSSAANNSASEPKENDLPKADNPRDANATALKHITNGLPSSLAPFFQGLLIILRLSQSETWLIYLQQWSRCSTLEEPLTMLSGSR